MAHHRFELAGASEIGQEFLKFDCSDTSHVLLAGLQL